MADGPYRGGQVHVLAEQCPTCVFRPGNLMRLERGRVARMVRESIEADSAIICHDTLYRDDAQPAVCRGFYDLHAHRVLPLRLAGPLGVLTEDPLPAPRRM